MEFDEKEYKISFFQEEDFLRKKCRACGSYFWTQNTEADTCGDAPCEEYTFIGNSPARKSFSVDESRESFLHFFEENGHRRIKPYPVISRWRDDLFVTIASIADFQPYVTEGVIPPPSNPLVISQPCLRFSDVDNVGLTAGRHFVIFEMGGAHAFNYPDKKIYWKDETVRYHHRFITEVFGVGSEVVTYKEGIWAGGGNAGPCVEGIVSGLEVCTLVFMQYRVVGDKYVDMPLKIVDTGYGIERYTWLSQGTPSAFHAVYGQILNKVMDLAGLGSVDQRFLVESAKFSALMKIESVADKMILRREVAQRLGIDPIELDRTITPIESAYAITDHTKALSFMLAEGVVPSNVKAGYLTRLLVRRTYRLLRILGIEDRMSDIVEWQIQRWSPSFPNLREMRDEIQEALASEEQKYRATLKRGQELTRRIARELKSRGQREIPDDTLVELYDSHGVPPEIVQEAAVAETMKVIVPDNFYTTVAARHSSPTPSEEVKSVDIGSELEGLPATETVYYDDPYVSEFKAKVLKVLGEMTVLDRTAFYPKSGGQDYDKGTLSAHGKTVRVVETQRIGNIIAQKVDEQVFRAGEAVTGRIDWERRISLMRHHTATHIVLGAIRRVLGEHSWQAGAEKEEEHSRLDVSHWDRITAEQLVEIEKLANQRVWDNIPVEVSWLQRDIAEKTYGFRLYQGGVVPGKEIRVVRVGDWDIEACGGTHLRSTGEVGLIKILHTERIQDGVERLVFACGSSALKYIQKVEEQTKTSSELLNVPADGLFKAVQDLSERVRFQDKEITQLKGEAVRYELLEELEKRVVSIGNVSLVTKAFKDIRPEVLIDAASALVKRRPDVVVATVSSSAINASTIVIAGTMAVQQGIDSGAIAIEMAKILGGSGGGRSNFGQGGGTRLATIPEALEAAKKIAGVQVRRP